MATTDRKRLRVMFVFTLQVGARRDRERLGRFQVLNHRAKINGLGIKCPVFSDFRSIQYFESVTFEHFLSAPAFKRDDLPIDSFLARAVKVTQVRAHQRPGRGNLSRIGEEIDMKVRDASRSSGHFAPTVHERPADKTTRALMIAKVAG